tara:strand:+ start:718 stop:990 length:273 start_codon:yes stop_codon:yes gene_type:complete
MKVINYIKKQLMAFRDIFKDDNDINEKNVVGFASFAIMTIFAFSDLITGHMGKDLVINELIYNSFVIITLGSFGISEVGKIWSKKNKTEE